MTKTKITMAFERITPAMAEQMLRKIHPRQKGRYSVVAVDTYADQMEAGLWDEDVVQTITIDEDGAVCDGVHRLNAVKKSGKTIRFLVVRGVSRDSFKNYDSGKIRPLSFRMGMDKDTTAVLVMYRKIAHYGLQNTPVRVEEFETCADFALSSIMKFNEVASAKRVKKISAAPVRAAAILQSMVHPNRLDEIAHAYSSLVRCDLYEAPRSMSALYRRLIDETHSQIMVFALAWRAFDPSKFHNTKLQINDLGAILVEVRDGPLKELTGAIRTAQVIELNREQAKQYRQAGRERAAARAST